MGDYYGEYFDFGFDQVVYIGVLVGYVGGVGDDVKLWVGYDCCQVFDFGQQY